MEKAKEPKQRTNYSFQYWSDEELALLEDNLGKPPREVAKLFPGRSRNCVAKKMSNTRRGIVTSSKPWTEAEDQVIRENSRMLSKALATLLPGRSKASVQGRRTKLIGRIADGRYDLDPNAVNGRTVLAKTCPKCGNLFAAKWFFRNGKSGRYSTACRTCHVARRTEIYRTDNPEGASLRKRESRRTRAYSDAAQKITLPLATRKGQEYTESDHKVLADPSKTALEKALLLERSYTGVRAALQTNGYTSLNGLGNPLEEIWVINNPNIVNLAAIRESNPMPREAQWDWDDAA